MYELAQAIMRDRLADAERHRLVASVRPPRPDLRHRVAVTLQRAALVLAPDLRPPEPRPDRSDAVPA